MKALQLMQVAKQTGLDQTTFTLFLIRLIVADGTPLDCIALNDQSVYDAWATGYSPWQLYYEIWQQDAGNYYAI